MALESNFLYMNFNEYFEKAKKSLNENDLKNAKKYLLRASEQLYKLAKNQNEGPLKQQWIKSADSIYQRAMDLNIESSTQKSFNIDEKSRFAHAEKNNESDPNFKFKPLEIESNIMFEDVIGLQEVKDYINLNVIKPFENPEIYEAFNKKPGGSVLLYGPPGTGKTMIAKAIANEINGAFFSIKASDIMSKWVGQSEQNISSLFKSVRSHEISVLFIDEIEALTAKRGSHNSTVLNRVVTEFLSQLDGFEEGHKKNTTLIVAATNLPKQIDPAIIRSGRFDRKIYIPLPDYNSRILIIEKKLKNLPLGFFDLDFIAESTNNFSGADLNVLVETASLNAIKRSLKTNDIQNIQKDDFVFALDKIKPSINEKEIEEYKKYLLD